MRSLWPCSDSSATLSFPSQLKSTERLHFHFSLSCIAEGNGNPLQCSCLENPRDGGAWWAAIYGVAQSWTRLKRLSACHLSGAEADNGQAENGSGCALPSPHALGRAPNHIHIGPAVTRAPPPAFPRNPRCRGHGFDPRKFHMQQV